MIKPVLFLISRRSLFVNPMEVVSITATLRKKIAQQSNQLPTPVTIFSNLCFDCSIWSSSPNLRLPWDFSQAKIDRACYDPRSVKIKLIVWYYGNEQKFYMKWHGSGSMVDARLEIESSSIQTRHGLIDEMEILTCNKRSTKISFLEISSVQ